MADLSRLIQGGMDLASAFGRGDSAYSRSMTDAARMEGLVLDAAKKREEMMARRGLGSAIQALGGSPDLATLFAAGVDPTKLSGYQGDMQEQGFRADAATRATTGDWDGANAALMGVANGPQQLATVEGQNLLANRFLAGANGVTTTEQGRASMAADAARARASDASAASSYASAARTRQATGIDAAEFGLKRSGQWDPGGGAGGGSVSGAAKATEDERKAAGWYKQATFALQQMDEALANEPAAAIPGLLEAYSPGEEVRNRSMSPQRQRYAQAASSFAEAALRAATGAGINAFEAQQKIRELTPQRGDSDEVVKQKRAAQGQYIESLRARAGRALPPDAVGGLFSGESTPQDVRRQSLLDKY